jgi:hypothetical protein
MEAVIEGGGMVKSIKKCSKVSKQPRREGVGFPVLAVDYMNLV